MKDDLKTPSEGEVEGPEREADQRADIALDHPSGLRSTLSTELAARQAEFRTFKAVNGLVEARTWASGDVIIRTGETGRDIYFVTKGVVEIWGVEESECVILNELNAPYIIGDMAFLSGLPRTATVKAKTEVKAFVLKHKNFIDIFKGNPIWLAPLLSSLVSGIKSLHYKISDREDKI